MFSQTEKKIGSCPIFCNLEINILGFQLTLITRITSNLYFVFFPKIWWETLSDGMSNAIVISKYSMLQAFSQSPGAAVSVINCFYFLGDEIVRKSSFEACQTLGCKPTNSVHRLLNIIEYLLRTRRCSRYCTGIPWQSKQMRSPTAHRRCGRVVLTTDKVSLCVG